MELPLVFNGIPCGSGCKVRITIDHTDPITIVRTQTEKRKNAGFFYIPEQSPGEHTAVLKIIELPCGVEYYLGQILVIGSVTY